MAVQSTTESTTLDRFRCRWYRRVPKETVDQFNKLMGQLSSSIKPLKRRRLRRILRDRSKLVYVVRDRTGRIVGTATLVIVEQLAGTKCWIEDVVVLEEFRGQGLGRALMEALIDAEPAASKCIDLTSMPDRVEAQHLYPKLGFEVRKTKVFRRRRES